MLHTASSRGARPSIRLSQILQRECGLKVAANRAGGVARTIVHHDYLKVFRSERLPFERFQTFAQDIRPVVRRYDHRELGRRSALSAYVGAMPLGARPPFVIERTRIPHAFFVVA